MTATGDSGAGRGISMKGGGYYSARTKGAKFVIDSATPLVRRALDDMEIADDPATPFSIADFGAADGGTSLALMGRVAETVRERAPGRPICLTYTDLPGNDFSQVFLNTQTKSAAGDTAKKPLADREGLYIFASGTSFYRQILPAGSLHLGFSATAMHWSSATAGVISDHVHAVGAKGAERAAFTRQGMKDWETILGHRARELAPGGRLVLVNFCIDEAGRYLGHTEGVDMFDTFNGLWRALRDEGTITADEYRRTNFPQVYKTVEEFRAPLEDPNGPLRKAGVALEHMETRVYPCPYKAEFLANGDVEAFAPAYIGTLRSWSETVFMNGLDPARPPDERRAIVEDFYKSYEDLVRAAPDGHAMDYVHVYMILSKDAGR